jgi:parallel beta-helix repeat protein/predicted outer membrane repeat protein
MPARTEHKDLLQFFVSRKESAMKTRTIGFVLVMIVCAMPLWAAGPTHVAAGDIQGSWTENSSPYMIEGDVVVPAGQTLTIGPRVKVRFSGHYKFTVNDTLKAEAKDGDKVKFTKDDLNAIWFTADLAANPAGWAGLRFVNATDCKLNYCIIEYGRAAGEASASMGGGIYCENASPSIANCTIRNNMASGAGGGIAVVGGKPSIANCSISGNSAGNQGGGVFVDKSKPTLANTSVSGNTSTAEGGGLAVINAGTVRVVNSSFSNNKSAIQGGGIYSAGSMIDLANGSLSENEKGGVAVLQGSTVRLTNCSVHDNKATEHGGGVFCSACTLTLTNASVNSNEQGGVYLTEASKADLTNCSIRSNGDQKSVDRDASSQANITNCSVKD